MSKMSDKIVSSYMDSKKENKTLGMYTVSCDLLGNHSTKIIIGSATPINLNTAREFIFASTGNKLIPYNESFKGYEDKNNYYASMIAYRSAIQHMSEEKGSKLSKVSANAYLDTELNQVWTKKEIEGKNFFIRDNNDDLESIMQNALYITSSSNVAVSVNPETFNDSVEIEDFVEFFTLDTEGQPGKAVGQISDISKDEDQVTINVMDTEIAIPIYAIINKVDMEAASSKAEVLEYLKKAYPDAYSNILTKIKK